MAKERCFRKISSSRLAPCSDRKKFRDWTFSKHSTYGCQRQVATSLDVANLRDIGVFSFVKSEFRSRFQYQENSLLKDVLSSQNEHQ